MMKHPERGRCGNDCSTCQAYIATRTNDDGKRKIVAEKWSKMYKTQILAGDIHCMGCRSEGPHFNFCFECPIRACANEKQVDTCAHCPDYRCKTLDAFIELAPIVGKQLELLRKDLSG